MFHKKIINEQKLLNCTCKKCDTHHVDKRIGFGPKNTRWKETHSPPRPYSPQTQLHPK